jgi:hypothetical protein
MLSHAGLYQSLAYSLVPSSPFMACKDTDLEIWLGTDSLMHWMALASSLRVPAAAAVAAAVTQTDFHGSGCGVEGPWSGTDTPLRNLWR